MLLLHALVVELLWIESVAIVHAIHRGRVEGIGLFGGIEHTRVDAIGLVLLLLLVLRPRAHGERCALGDSIWWVSTEVARSAKRVDRKMMSRWVSRVDGQSGHKCPIEV